MANPNSYGPSRQQLDGWRPVYVATPQALSTTALGKNTGKAKGILLSSPLVQGSEDFNYHHDLLYPKQRGWSSKWPIDTRQWVYHNGNKPINPTTGSRGRGPVWASNEEFVSADSYAGDAEGFVLNGKTGAGKRPSSTEWTGTLLGHIQSTINSTEASKGLFSSLIPNAANGFVIAKARDFDEPATNGDGANAGAFDVSSYWRLANKDQPLDHLYRLYYDKNRKDNILASNFKANGDKLAAKQADTIDLSKDNDPYIISGGPFSNTSLKLGNGNNIVALSPAMMPAYYRLKKFDGSKPDDTDAYFNSNTILYPSSVGAHASNSLSLGNGNNVVYYDSSLKDVAAGAGHNVFLPSFGAFNWSADWLHALETGVYNDSQGASFFKDFDKPLISPIPWDLQAPNPKGDGAPLDYATRSANVAAVSVENRSQLASQGNLYTVNVQEVSAGQSNTKKSYLYDYFNGTILQGGDVHSYNPVNRLGGMTLKANGGDNTFFGLDWRLWEGLLPTYGTTTANQPADPSKKIKRAVVNNWHTVTMLGGRGSNKFWLGNVIDDITNNGAFYDGTASYYLSLTHDKIYRTDELNNPRQANFGNIYGQGNNGSGTLSSIVNLSLQADPTTVTVITQEADPGQEGPKPLDYVGPFNSVANFLNKGIGNPEKGSDTYKNWIAGKSGTGAFQKLAATALKAVPWVDLGVSAVSAAVGLISLFQKTPAKPPKQEITASYQHQPQLLDRKAVMINDWHPYSRININIPARNPGALDTLQFTLAKPPAASSGNIDQGTHILATKSFSAPNSTSLVETSFPLVVLENVDKNTSNFGYYSYSFLESYQADLSFNPGSFRASDWFTRIGADHLDFFGNLPNPSKVLDENGNPQALTTIPVDDFVYKSAEGFDMRHDAANYAAFNDGNGTNDFYSRYYFNVDTGSFPTSGWSADKNVWPYTTVVSLEFDSRKLGWYWQPVLKQDPNGNPVDADIDFDQSKLWIKPGRGRDWIAYSFDDINNRVAAYQASLMATTSYYLDDREADQDPSNKGASELRERARLFSELSLLKGIGIDDITALDQTGIRHELQRLLITAQIQTVKQASLTINGVSQAGVIAGIQSVDSNSNPTQTQLFLYKQGDQAKAVYADEQQRILSEKVQRLAGLVGPDLNNLSNDWNWWPRPTAAKMPPSFIDSLDQVRDVEFDFNGKPGIHRITYKTNYGNREIMIRLEISEVRPGEWLAEYIGEVDVLVPGGATVAKGSTGNDELIGSGVNSDLRGGAGDDRLLGGEGQDQLKGGKGADDFVFQGVDGVFRVDQQGRDRIIDFTRRQGDQIALDRIGFGLRSLPGIGFSQGDEFASVLAVEAADLSAARIVFVRESSELIYNANGVEAGYGADGGSFAKVVGIADLSSPDFLIL